MEEFVKYNNLVEVLYNYNYNQLLSYFDFSCTFSTKAFKVIEKENFRYILYIEPKNNLIQCYDLNTSKVLTKINIFLIHYHTIDYNFIIRCLNTNNIPICKEFDLSEPKDLNSVLSLYFRNIPKQYFEKLNISSQTFLSFMEHPALNGNISYNKDLDKYSFPIFSDGNYTVCDFLDFSKEGYQKRYNCEFGIWYSQKLQKSFYVPGPRIINDDFDEDPIKTNVISLSYNPAALISSLKFFSSSITINNLHILLSEPFSSFSFFRFVGLFSSDIPGLSKNQHSFFDFEKVHLIYDNDPQFAFKDLFSLLRFSIYAINFSNPDFSLELDSIKYNYIKIYYLKTPEKFKFTDLQEVADNLSNTIHTKYCGKGSQVLNASEITQNIDFIKDYTYYASKHTYVKTKKTILGFSFPAKAEFIIIFLKYLFDNYLPAFELYSFNGRSIFTDSPNF